MGGCIVDAGTFDWMAHAGKFPGLTTPDESYHGVVYAEKFGQGGAFITKCTSQLMRDFGSIQSPQHAFILNLGLESLHEMCIRDRGRAYRGDRGNHGQGTRHNRSVTSGEGVPLQVEGPSSPSPRRPQRNGPSDCLPKTQDSANPRGEV